MLIGREDELKMLNKRYDSARFEMVVIYGRRRVGKTALINEFVKDKPVEGRDTNFVLADDFARQPFMELYEAFLLAHHAVKNRILVFFSCFQVFTSPLLFYFTSIPILYHANKKTPAKSRICRSFPI